MDGNAIAALAASVENATALAIVDRALETFGNDCAISFSGAEDVLLIEYAAQTKRPFRVFSLDTGRLHPETLQFMHDVERHYDLRIEYCVPAREDLEPFVRTKGLFSFYEDGHEECCGIRKVAPLRRHLATLRAWITGVRRDQSQGARANTPTVLREPQFEGRDGPLVKFNPLASMTSEEVWAAIRAFEVPHNPLHLNGMKSIGCAPCTTKVKPGEDPRAGRWRGSDKTECGIHIVDGRIVRGNPQAA